MVWRASAAEAKHQDGASRRAQIKSRIDGGVPVGLIFHRDDRPVAWCSIAPRETYRPLGGPPIEGPAERVWSLACFYVRRGERGQGLTARMIEAAVAHAKAGGATIVEGYPVDPHSPSYRFMGFVEAFAAAGFREVGRAGSRRHVMRLALS